MIGDMTVKRLRELLSLYPDDMPVIHRFCSDYCDLPKPQVIKVIPNLSNDEYLHFYPHQHPEPPTKNVMDVLYFSGN